MRHAHSRILSGVIRQATLASESFASSLPGTGASTTAEFQSSGRSSFATWLDSCPRCSAGAIGSSSLCLGGALASGATRGLSGRSQPPPDAPPHSDSTRSTASINPAANGERGSSSSSATAAPPRQPVGRGKSARHLHLAHARGASAAGSVQLAARASKDKAPKVPSAKAAAAMAAAKAGGQQPLPREARLQLDAQLAEMPLPPPQQLPYRGTHGGEGPRTVQVTGFYIGHPFTRASAEAVAARFRQHPLAPGVAVAGEYHDHEDALITLTLNPSHNHHQQHLHPAPAPAPTAPAPASRGLPAAPASAATEPHAGADVGAATTSAAASQQPTASAPADASALSASPLSSEGAAAGAGLARAEAALGPAPDPGPGQTHAESTAELPGAALALAPTADASAAGGGDGGPLGSYSGGGEDGNDGGSGSSRQDACCMAVMLLEYGGVVFFNVPESLHASALARVAAALPAEAVRVEGPGQGGQAGLGLHGPLRSAGRAEAEAWQQAVAEKLSVHKEEQLVVVDPNLMASRGSGRWIRKRDDSLHIWSWDSTNLESCARVLSQSAAIRYYNQECEDMLERYETIMPLGYEPPDRLSALDRLLFWRSRLPLSDLRQMVFKSSGIRVRLDSRLGLRDPPSGTWESARHHAVWEAMRREFELDDRRDNLMDKTELLKQSCLDLISANNESFTKRSELSIILLISVEILISLTDMHSALSAENIGRAAGWAMRAAGLGGGSGDGGAGEVVG